MDEEIKAVLAKKDNGVYLETDLIAHAEYFYNTLDCNSNTINPFLHPKKYPALLFQLSEN